MSVEDNKETVRRYIEDVWNQGNLDLIDELCETDVVSHTDHYGSTVGAADRRRVAAAFLAAFPGLYLEIHDLFGERDLVAARGTMRATQEQEVFGIPPQGRHVTVDGVLMARLRDGKISELWVHYDFEGFLRQLGVPIETAIGR